MNLDVLIPSLFLPAPVQTLIQPPKLPKPPMLERMLARADRQIDVTCQESSWLCEQWGLKAPYPVAPLLAGFDALGASSGGWMFAEPIHVTPDRESRLFPARFLELNSAEVTELVAALNSHFADRQLKFFAPVADRWYVQCVAGEIPETTPPDQARVGSLVDFQPRSTGKLNWRSLQNEAQMLLFGHPVNLAREAAGKPVVSGVWFWGGGVPPVLHRPPYDRVVTSSPLASQLAMNTGIDSLPLAWESVESGQGNVLAVIDSCANFARDHDLSGWAREVERIDRDWLMPISQALSGGTIRQLMIHAPGAELTQSFRITRGNQLLRFWRAARPLSSYA